MATKPLGLALRSHEGFHTVTPYLVVSNAAAALDFYKKAFGAVDLQPALKHPDNGKVAHVEIRIGDSPIMLTDEFPEFGNRGPQSAGTSVHLHLYVEDADAVVKRAIAAGAKEVIPVGDQFYGARSGRITDPYGHVWIVETQKEELAPPERQKRFEAFIHKMKG